MNEIKKINNLTLTNAPSVHKAKINSTEVQKVNIEPFRHNQFNQVNIGGDGPTLLLQMMNDPLGAVQFLRSLFMLQDVLGMLPLANQVISDELEALFKNLMCKPEEIVNELLNQQGGISLFKGELFDLLRKLIKNNPDLRTDVSYLLREINNELTEESVLQSMKSNMEYLVEAMKNLKQGEKLKEVLLLLHHGVDPRELHEELRDALKELESSILYSPKLAKNISILQYNYSRLLGHMDLQSMLHSFRYSVDAKTFQELYRLVNQFMEASNVEQIKINQSKVLEVMMKILDLQVKNQGMVGMSQDKIERIVYSLLASPSNFTPLMHFILPLQYEGLMAFGELWIDVNSRNERDEEQKATQILLALEFEGLGHFELDLRVLDTTMVVRLFTPQALEQAFQGMRTKIRDCLTSSMYSLERVEIIGIEKPRTLMEVFQRLPEKRSGVSLYA